MKNSFRTHHLLEILNNYDADRGALDSYMHGYFKSHRQLGSKDRKEISEKIYGLVRWQRLIDELAGNRASWQKRLELFDSPNFLDAQSKQDLPAAVRLSCPEVLYKYLLNSYEAEAVNAICQVNNEQAPLFVRVNPDKIQREELIELWKDSYTLWPCAESPWGIHIEGRHALFTSDAFKLGYFEIQDEASQIAALHVDASPGQHVMDYCAGSGGKTLAFAHKMEGKGQIYLHDIREQALTEAKRRCKRAGVQNCQFISSDSAQKAKLKRKMDWVLADVPCSGTGTLRRNPDLKWKFSSEMLQELVGKQRRIFEEALSFVKVGGHIVYVTCSILKEENELQIEHFLHHYPVKLQKSWSSKPTSGGMDGLFVAVLLRL